MKIAVSGKGGVGKTTVAVNTAAHMAQVMHLRVGLLDADLMTPNAHLMLSLDNSKVVDLGGMLSPVTTKEGVKFMSMALCMPRGTGVALTPDKVHEILLTMLRYVKWDVDYLLIDCPPSSIDVNVKLMQELKGHASAVLVSEPHPFSLEDNLRMIDLLRLFKIGLCCIVLNKANLFPEEYRKRVISELKYYADIVEIPWDMDLTRGIAPNKPYWRVIAEHVVA